jgi:hypothetical protein
MRNITFGLVALLLSCSDWDGYSKKEGDCDLHNPGVNPGAIEKCNGIDDDCDGLIDEGCDTATPPEGDADADTDADSDADTDTPDDTGCEEQTWYQDGDGDGYGGVVSFESCDQPPGYVDNSDDCDDGDDQIYPGAPEACDGVDQDCDGDIDENSSSEWFVDADGDGYGAGDAVDVICNGDHAELVDNADDCADDDSAVNPAATEVCDGIDNDCDGLVDDEDDSLDLGTADAWFADGDGDGFGDASSGTLACEQPSGYVADATDCNDGSASIYPGAPEYCNGSDDDCDGVTDESDALDASTWYYDGDGDGFGLDASAYVACEAPDGYVAVGGDCDDASDQAFPGGTEVCGDGLDNDCEGTVDGDDAVDVIAWYPDGDGDGYGEDGAHIDSCEQPSGYVEDNTDCDDASASRFPGNPEVCDGIDNDCDSVLPADEQDADGDLYAECEGDCDDADPTAYPGAAEVCDGIDNDCDGVVPSDEIDGDGDLYAECEGDCDDADAALNPGTVWYYDLDQDGFGQSATYATAQCEDPSDAVIKFSTATGDCNDGREDINPSATEECDGIDNDCDGRVDEDNVCDTGSDTSDTGTP